MTSFHKLPIILAFFLTSCAQEKWYKKEFSIIEKVALSESMMAADERYFYQGTIPMQFLMEEALTLDPNHALAWREQGAATVKRGLAVEAMSYWEHVLDIDAQTWQGWRGYLYLYFYRDYVRAIADFDATDSLTLDFTDYPQGQSVDYMRGIAYYALGDYQSALNYFTKYIDEVSEDEGESWVSIYAFLYRGLVYEKLNRYDLALADFDKTIKYDENLSDAYYHEARIFLNQGDVAKAIRMLATANTQFKKGFYHQRPYVEVIDQVYQVDIDHLAELIQFKISK